MKNTKAYLRQWGFLVLFLLGTMPSYAQDEAPTNYQERKFDQNRLREYRENPEYAYPREKPEPLKRKPKEEERYKPIPNIHYSAPRGDFSGFAKAIFWILIIGGGVFLIFQIMKVDFKGLVKKRSDKSKLIAEVNIENPEDISKMEFDDLLQQAIDAGRFRVAVRLLYLRSLRQLSDKSLIAWKQDKTNREYLRELKDNSLRPIFGDVTLIFEYIWYGEFPVNKDDFNLARASFLKFDQTLRQKDAV
jgi:hypothetical protein